MTDKDITRLRLISLQLAGTRFTNPEDLVAWMGGIQAQDFEHAKYAIGVRMPDITNRDVENAIHDRRIVRSWPMRGTLHLVAATDIRWILQLLAPEMETVTNTSAYKTIGLDVFTLKRAYQIIIKSLEGGNYLTRPELAETLERNGVAQASRQLSHILYRAGQDGIVCFGNKKGNQHCYVLLDEWIPECRAMHRDDALAELAKRYFQSHGPATLDDFKMWSGLSPRDARSALAFVSYDFREKPIDGKLNYWKQQDESQLTCDPLEAVLMLPGFHEYILGYSDKSKGLDPRYYAHVLKNGIFSPAIVDHGEVTGTWKRTVKKGKLQVEVNYFEKGRIPVVHGVLNASKRYAQFMEMDILQILHTGGTTYK